MQRRKDDLELIIFKSRHHDTNLIQSRLLPSPYPATTSRFYREWGGDGVDGDNIVGDVPTPLTDENVDCEDINEDGTFTLNEIETEQQQERPKRVLKKSKYQKTPYTEHAPTK
ncbi:hypothetical protein BUALT_Bualt14G0004800 [Buddleja alternifolia]|uniref:Uncharacterized protein n=1 Tax=Buddleja alternifolia TaxID=168488 RepID=A0AAV6WMX4_9LAMI|nr:hypothetical protein BUALT_Bualt14G0004800 [Buddleja alternifolia]